jgi:hypothetical protein
MNKKKEYLNKRTDNSKLIKMFDISADVALIINLFMKTKSYEKLTLCSGVVWSSAAVTQCEQS